MTKSNIYDAVKKAIGIDPYAYVASFISTNTVYHKQSIDTSYRKILANKKKASITTSTAVESGNPITQSFKNLIKSWENNKSYKPGGWNPKKEKWYPHKSPEGGTPTIAYGHKLTRDDVNTDKFKNGLTDSEASKLFDSDLIIAQSKAMKLFPNFSKLPTATKQALINSCYRGEMSETKMPNTLKLMRAGKWKAAAAEYLNNEEYRIAGANVRGRMEWNARQFAATSKFGFVS
jgi:GH24 family phage-related lysozyme (muramidase)